MKINYMFSRIDRDKGFNDNQKKYINRNSAKDLVDYVLNKWYTNR